MRLFDSWWLDVKLGWRMLIKYPGLALAGGTGIAVAVALAAGGMSVVQRNFRASSVPLDDSGRIVSVEIWDSLARAPEQRILRDFLLWREGVSSVRELSAYRTFTANLISPNAPPEVIRAAAITPSGFGVARVPPQLGRYLTEEDERPGAPNVAVIGDTVWRSRFAADPAIVGRTIQLGDARHTIVGVMPPGFAFPVNHHLWIPFQAPSAPPEPLSGPAISVFGRLASGLSLEMAQSGLLAVNERSATAHPKVYASLKPQIAPYPLPILNLHSPEDVGGIIGLQGAVLTLLVLVCLNVGILVFTRTAMRQSEIAVRTALGAGRSRIVGQLFLEALVLSAIAATVGLGIAALTLGWVSAATQHIAPDLPFWISFRLSPGGVIYAALLSILGAVIVGVLPGLPTTGRLLNDGLRAVGAGQSGSRLGRTWTVLIVAQVAVAVAILPPSVLSGWHSLQSGLAGPGFAADRFLSAHLDMDPVKDQGIGAASRDRFAVRHAELLRRLESGSTVAAATFAMKDPGDEKSARIEPQGREGEAFPVHFNRVAVNFFRTFEVPVLAGRDFGTGDLAPDRGDNLPPGNTVIVNRPLAEKLFGGDALGRHIRYNGSNNWYEIVGVVNTFPTGVSPTMQDNDYKIYHAAAPGQMRPSALAIRMRGTDLSSSSRDLRLVAAEVDSELQLRDIRGLEEVLRKEQWIRRLEAGVLLGVTFSVLILSAAGIYALMSFTVAQRQREIGIRIALGASSARVITAIFSRALWQLGAGAAIGVLIGFGVTASAAGEEADGAAPLALAAVILAAIAVGLLAVLGPTRRCLRVHPAQALREQ